MYICHISWIIAILIIYKENDTWEAVRIGTEAAENVGHRDVQQASVFGELVPVKFNPGTGNWENAQADVVTNVASGLTTNVTPDSLDIIVGGVKYVPAHGYTVGQIYYLSATTPGGVTTTPPAIVQPVFHVLTVDLLSIYPIHPANAANFIAEYKTADFNAVENADINSIEVYAAELEAKLEVIEDKDLNKAITALADIFGIEVSEAKIADKDEARKAMGLKPKAKTKK